MADLSGPFDSAPWAQTEWYNFAPTWAPSGIIGSPAASIGVGDFAVTASGLTLTVACVGDRAWIDGSGYKPDTDKTLAVAANANASLSRRDRIVIRRDLAAKTISVVRLAGTPAGGTPAAPDLTQITGGIYEVPVCSFLVPPNNGTALTGFIDERLWTSPSGLALANAAARSALNPASSEYVRSRVTEIDTGRVVQSDGSKWVKVGGPPELLASALGAPTGGVIANTGVETGVVSVAIPAHTAGTLDVRWEGAWSAGQNGACYIRLYVGPSSTFSAGVAVPGAQVRSHNQGSPYTYPVTVEGHITTAGTAGFAVLTLAVDTAGGPASLTSSNWAVWLI